MGRQALDEEGHGVVDRGRLDQVVVVEGEDERGRVALEVGDQARHDGLGGRAGGGLEEHLRSGPDPRRSPPDRGDEVGEEAGQVVVGGVEGEPGEGVPVRALPPGRVERQPLGEQRGLAEARRRGDEDEPGPVVRVRRTGEVVGQPGPRHEQPPRDRRPELGPEHGHGPSLGPSSHAPG